MGGFASSLAFAADAKPDISAAFKGTIVSTYSDGRQAKLWLAPDGTYKAEGRKHDPSNGKWRIKGEQICLNQSHPHPILPVTYCTAIPTGGVGRSWDAKSVMGDPIKVSLTAGGRKGG
jgi:1-acyl-sn-glycerol-3-phosphate acyltransferase